MKSILRCMFLTPFTSLTWAYQLHYYVAFRTYRRRPSLAANFTDLSDAFREICKRHDYHLLEFKPEPAQVLCLLSLQPAHTISKVLQTLKSNSSRLVGLPKPGWARGYLAPVSVVCVSQRCDIISRSRQSITTMPLGCGLLFIAIARASRSGLQRRIVASN